MAMMIKSLSSHCSQGEWLQIDREIGRRPKSSRSVKVSIVIETVGTRTERLLFVHIRAASSLSLLALDFRVELGNASHSTQSILTFHRPLAGRWAWHRSRVQEDQYSRDHEAKHEAKARATWGGWQNPRKLPSLRPVTDGL